MPAKPAAAKAAAAKAAAAKAYRRRKARAAAMVAALPITNGHACGIDSADRSHWVCVGFAQDDNSPLLREFPAHTAGLLQIVAYLREHGVTTVAMESTGIYWVPLFELLDKEG